MDEFPCEEDPLRGPNWRWQQAHWLLRHGVSRHHRAEDEYVEIVIRYLREAQKANRKGGSHVDRLRSRYPELHWAIRLYQSREDNENLANVVEAYLLAPAKLEHIARQTGASTGLIVWYEKLFFNVLPLLSSEGYVIDVVLGSAAHPGQPQPRMDLFWKMVAYAGGSLWLEHYLRPLPHFRVEYPEQIRGAEDRAIRDLLRKRAVVAIQTAPLPAVHRELMRLYLQFVRLEQLTGRGGVGDTLAHHALACLRAMKLVIEPNKGEGGIPRLRGSAELRAGEKIRIALGLQAELEQ